MRKNKKLTEKIFPEQAREDTKESVLKLTEKGARLVSTLIIKTSNTIDTVISKVRR